MSILKIISALTTFHFKVSNKNSNELNLLTPRFKHLVRPFVHGNRHYKVDSIDCHAAPGTIETSIMELMELLSNNPQNNRILNLGGGTGQVSEILKFLGFDVYNLDIEIKKNDNKNTYFDLNSNDNLPYSDHFFDFILCQEVIEHIENPWALFRKIKKVLKNPGYLVLTTPNIQSKHSKKIFKKSGYFHWFEKKDLSYHINAIPYWEIGLIAQKHHFHITKLLGNGDYFFHYQKQLSGRNVLKNNECLIILLKQN